ncbi:hypothetical protein scyTo_0026200, partial [Scyliorhinus torazame]|nr:hypothetical protein [Scyliorhinus torazame]
MCASVRVCVRPYVCAFVRVRSYVRVCVRMCVCTCVRACGVRTCVGYVRVG